MAKFEERQKISSAEVLNEMEFQHEANFELLQEFEREYKEKHSSFIRNVIDTLKVVVSFLWIFFGKAPIVAKLIIIFCCFLLVLSLPLLLLVTIVNLVMWFIPIVILGPPILFAWLTYGAYITPSLVYDPVARSDELERLIHSRPDFEDFWRTGNFISRSGHRIFTHFWSTRTLGERLISSPLLSLDSSLTSISHRGPTLSSPNVKLPQENPPKAIIFIVHGLIEHCRRYDHVAERLVKENFVVYSLDHQGHGRSEGRRAYFSSIAGLAIDYLDYIHHIKSQYYPDLPVFVMGHSLGGLVTMHMIILQPELFIGFALSSPLLLPPSTLGNPISPIAIRVLNRWSPRLPLIPLILDTLCGDPDVESSVYKDPYCHQGRLAPRTIHALDKGLQFLHKNVTNVKHPFLVMQGMKDKIVNPQGATFLYANASSEDKTLRLYESLYHEIFNEKDGLECVEHAITFFNKVLNRKENELI